MSVTIPSDLILDVLRNAPSNRMTLPPRTVNSNGGDEMTQSTQFTDHLDNISSGTSEDDLIADVLQAASRSEAALATKKLSGLSSVNGDAGPWQQTGSPQLAFEQMFIRSMFNSMLPKADSGLYGTETASSDVWRSLVVDQLAGAYSNGGGLGIAAKLERGVTPDGPTGSPQWPYFEQSNIAGFVG